MDKLNFMTQEQATEVKKRFGSPAFVYDEKKLRSSANAVLNFPNAFGLTARYAMKASSNAAILNIFAEVGLKIDASSGHEIERALRAGIPAEDISLSTQQLPENFADYYNQGVSINACSIDQLNRFGAALPGGKIGLRFNPGVGSGGTQKTNVGGPSSSFGIWHEKIDEVKQLVEQHGLNVFRIHTHIGSGSDPAVWQKTAALSLDLVRQFPTVTSLNLGGGYKVGRAAGEVSTDLQVVGAPVKEAFENLAEETGRKIHLEIEPGTWLVANACSLVTTVQDMTDTGVDGHRFLKLDAGMTELLRPSLYAAQHPFVLLPQTPTDIQETYVIVGHCCESGDLLTPCPDDAEALNPKELPQASIGDLCVIEGVGAYCSSMTAKNYNSFPEAPEVMLRENGSIDLIRRRQTMEQILQNEVPLQS